LLRNRPNAEDVAQEAMLRAYRFFDQFRGGDARAWLLQIVRNSCYTWLEKNRPMELMTEFDEELHVRPSANPETLATQADERGEADAGAGIAFAALPGSACLTRTGRLLV